MPSIQNKLETAFRKDSRYKPFLLVTLFSSLSIGLYNGILSNYLAEIVGMGEFNRGVAEFFRELPGLMLVFVLAIFYTFSAEKLVKLGAVIMIAGMAMHAIIPGNTVLVIIAMSLYSLGEHIQLGMNSTLSLEYSIPGNGGRAQGYQHSVNQAGRLIGFLIITVTFMFAGGEGAYRAVYAGGTAVVIAAFIASLQLTDSIRPDESKRRFYFDKKFKKYYMLEIFYGARKQVFFTFGPYVLVLFYGAKTAVISLLFAISAIACSLLSPLIGRIIDRFGYKIVMVMDTLILVIVCFFYGFAHHIFSMNVAFIVCCVNYILDSVISLASMASNVYVQDIAESQEEVKATISTGLSVNHLITILISLFGGWIWQTLGIETLFILSAILGLCNSAYAASIKTEKAS